MNEVLRVLEKIFKKSGYTIKKHPKYNLLPLKDYQNNPLLKNVYDSFDNREQTVSYDDISMLNICLRTCINKNRAGQSYNELTGVAVEDHLLKCIQSLFISINEAIKNLRESISADDPEPIKAKTEELAQISMKLGEAMYKKQQETNGAGNESAGESASANGNVGDSGGKAEEDENVIDAPFEELDDEDKKGKSS